MKTKRNAFVQEEIDRKVIAQSDDETAWENPVKVRRPKLASVWLPAALAARAEFFARLHRDTSLEKWLHRVIQERLDIEEAAFAGFKKEMLSRK